MKNIVVVIVVITLLWRFLVNPAPLVAVGLFAGSTVAVSTFLSNHPKSKLAPIFFLLYFGFWGTVTYLVIHYIIVTWK